MILRVTYEEVSALNSAAKRLLGPSSGGGVVAPPEAMAELEARLPVSGDVSVDTLAQQARLLGALDFVLTHLKRRMDAVVLEQYVGADDAVNAYFDYANVLTTRTRLEAIGREMAALIELMTGEPPTSESAERITFAE